MSEPTIAQLLLEAERAANDGRWDDAERAYDLALQSRQDLASAITGRRRVGQLRERVADLTQKLADADALFAQAVYAQAESAYNDILNQAAQAGVQSFHEPVNRKRLLARELARFKRRADEAAAELARLSASAEAQPASWSELLGRLDGILRDLPPDKPYEAIAETLRAARTQVEQQIDVQTLVQRATDAWKGKDFESVVRLVDALGSQAPPSLQQAYKFAADILSREIRPVLDQVQELLAGAQVGLAEGRNPWEQARVLLSPLRAEYASNPDLRRAWLRVALEQGQYELDVGYRTCLGQQPDFDAAHNHFVNAQHAFESAAEIAPEDAFIQRIGAQVADLQRVAIKLAHCQHAWKADQRDEALRVAQEVERELTAASANGRDHAAIGSVTRSMRQAIETEITLVEEGARKLQLAEQALEQRQLLEARQHFEALRGTVLAEQRTVAEAAIARIDADRQVFAAAMTAGAAASDPREALAAYDRAYHLWPSGPDVRRALELALLRAAEALIESDPVEALRYARRVLSDFNAESQIAARLIEQPALADRVRSALQNVREQAVRLLQSGPSGDFEALIEELESHRTATADAPVLRNEVAAAIVALRADQKRRETFEELYDQARRHQTEGDWDRACALLAEARTALGPSAPPEFQQEEQRWLRAQKAVARLEHAAERAAQAQTQYAGEEFGAAADTLDRLLHDLATATELAVDASGSLPERLAVVQRDASNLQKKVVVAREVLNAPPTDYHKVSVRISSITSTLGHDEVLSRIGQRLRNQQRDRIPQLLKEAENELRSGELDKAFERVLLARDIGEDSAEITRLYEQVTRRRRLEETFKRAETDANDKVSTNSLVAAMGALRRGLDELQNPDLELSKEVRELLARLTALGDSQEEMAFGDVTIWREAEALLIELDQHSGRGWEEFRVGQIARKWAQITRRHATRRVVESMAVLKDFLRAYETATNEALLAPDDDQVIARISDFAEKAIAQLNDSAKNRLYRADKALERGDYETAIENLSSIEAEVYGPVRSNSRISSLLESGSNKIVEVEEQADQLRRRADTMARTFKEKEPVLIEAEQLLFVKGDAVAAEEKLRQVTGVDEIPPLHKRADALRTAIDRMRRESSLTSLERAVVEAETILSAATTAEQLATAITRLEGLPLNIDWGLLNVEQRQDYQRVLQELRERRESLIELDEWEIEAQTALDRSPPDHERAEAALKRALALVKEPSRRVRLDRSLAEVILVTGALRKRSASLDEAQRLLSLEQYREAQEPIRQLREARVDHALIDRLQRWRKAGLLYEEALEAQQRQELDEAVACARQAGELAAQIEGAETIAHKCERLLSRLEQQLKQRDDASKLQGEINKLYEAGVLALLSDNYDKAEEHARTALARNPDEEKIHRLLGEIRDERRRQQQQQDIHRLLGEARALMKEGQLNMAQARLNAANEIGHNSEVSALAKEIEYKIEQVEVLASVEALAAQRKFRSAHSELAKVLNRLTPDNREEIRARLAQREREWQDEMLRPILNQAHDPSKIETAIGLYQQTRRRISDELTDDARDRVQRELTDLINRLVDGRLVEIRTLFERLNVSADDIEAINEMIGRIERLQAFDPQPGVDQQEQLQSLLRQLRAASLHARLDAARVLRAAGNLDAARQEADAAAKSAQEYQLTALSYKAVSLVLEIEEQTTQAAASQSRSRLDEMLDQAEALLLNAETEHNFKRLFELLDRAEQLDPEHADQLGAQLERLHELRVRGRLAHEQYSATRAVLEEADRLLRNASTLLPQTVSDAAAPLRRLDSPWPSLASKHQRYSEAFERLTQALAAVQAGQWLAGYQAYERALQLIPEHELLIRAGLDECQHNLTRVIGNARAVVQTALGHTPPDYVKATNALLDARRDAGSELTAHLQEEIRRELSRRRDALLAEQRFDEAIKVTRELARLSGDAAEGEVRSLSEARAQRLDELHATIREALVVDAVGAAEQALQQVNVILGDEVDPRFAAFPQQLLERRRAVQYVDDYLDAIEQTAEQSGWRAAVTVLLDLWRRAPAYARLLAVVDAWRARLVAEAEQRGAREEFLEALALTEAAASLTRAESDRVGMEELRRGLDERYAALKEQLRQTATQGLNVWDLHAAGEALGRAERIGAGGAVADLRQHADQLASHAPALHGAMERGWSEIAQGNFAVAMATFEEVAAGAYVPFPEAQRWSTFCGLLDRALQAYHKSEYSKAVTGLRQAEYAMRAEAPRPPSFPGSAAAVLAHRKSAVTVAGDLAQRIARLDELHGRAEEYYTRGLLDEEQATIEQFDDEEREFAVRYESALAALKPSPAPPLSREAALVGAAPPSVAPVAELSAVEKTATLPLIEAEDEAASAAEAVTILPVAAEAVTLPLVEAEEMAAPTVEAVTLPLVKVEEEGAVLPPVEAEQEATPAVEEASAAPVVAEEAAVASLVEEASLTSAEEEAPLEDETPSAGSRLSAEPGAFDWKAATTGFEPLPGKDEETGL